MNRCLKGPVLVLVIALGATATTVTTPSLPVASVSAAAVRPLRVLAAGDSFAAGEGLPAVQIGEEACQRALGQRTADGQPPSKAWPVLVKEMLETGRSSLTGQSSTPSWQVDPFWLTACTGNTAENFARVPTTKGSTQIGEAGSAPYDVVTLSFGGNDVGFDSIIKDCVNLDLAQTDEPLGDRWSQWLDRFGCSRSEADINADIDRVLGERLPRLYDEVAGVTRPGGLVVVTGYPQVIEDPNNWSGFAQAVDYCRGFTRFDTAALRGVAGRLNRAIGIQVDAAQARHPELEWLFVDVASAFESPNERHGLCTTQEWFNGPSTGLLGASALDNMLRWYLARSTPAGALVAVDRRNWRIERSFHPNQFGQFGYADAVIAAIRASGWSPAQLRVPEGCTKGEGDCIGSLRVDVDGDGAEDLVEVFGSMGGGRIRLDRSGGPPSEVTLDIFGPPEYVNQSAPVGVTDINGDGKRDIAAIASCGMRNCGIATALWTGSELVAGPGLGAGVAASYLNAFRCTSTNGGSGIETVTAFPSDDSAEFSYQVTRTQSVWDGYRLLETESASEFVPPAEEGWPAELWSGSVTDCPGIETLYSEPLPPPAPPSTEAPAEAPPPPPEGELSGPLPFRSATGPELPVLSELLRNSGAEIFADLGFATECWSLTVLGWDPVGRAADVDLVYSPDAIGRDGERCGGDTTSTFIRIRGGRVVGEFFACGDCDSSIGDTDDYRAAIAPYAGREALAVTLGNTESGWYVASVEQVTT